MNVDELLSGAREAITVRRVYGDPIEQDGVDRDSRRQRSAAAVEAAATTRTTAAAASGCARGRSAPT